MMLASYTSKWAIQQIRIKENSYSSNWVSYLCPVGNPGSKHLYQMALIHALFSNDKSYFTLYYDLLHRFPFCEEYSPEDVA